MIGNLSLQKNYNQPLKESCGYCPTTTTTTTTTITSTTTTTISIKQDMEVTTESDDLNLPLNPPEPKRLRNYAKFTMT